MLDGLERWKGKTALITGASAGIGTAVAHALARAGMRLALAARRADRLQALREALERDHGAEVLTLPVDLRDEEAIHDLFARLRSEWGGVDVLVNNAGIGYSKPMLETDLAHLRAMLEVNVWAPTVCIKEALQDMAGREDAAIVNISSLAGHRVVAGRPASFYAATKHHLRAMTEGLRSELQIAGSRIKLAMVSPGMVETEFHLAANPKGEPIRYASPPLKADDIADAVLYILATPQHVQVNDVLIRPIEQAH